MFNNQMGHFDSNVFVFFPGSIRTPDIDIFITFYNEMVFIFNIVLDTYI